MAWRPSDWVLAGELDNKILGWTTGWLKIEGIEEPLKLKLAGNCHPDLAGWKFKVVRTDPIPDWAEPLSRSEKIATDQSGHVGDITADQLLKQFECSVEEFLERTRAGDPPPTTLHKALYLEWFSNNNGRVVIQCTRLAVERIGERTFELSEEEWVEQARRNNDEMGFFMHAIGDALENGALDREEPDDSSPEEG
jgi:hypothetical protein